MLVVVRSVGCETRWVATVSDLRDHDDDDLVEALWRYLRAHELTAALPISEELSRRFDAETAAAAVAWLARILLTTAEQASVLGDGSTLRGAVRIVALHGQTLHHWIVRVSRVERRSTAA
jgi:hypothetical protein